MSKSRAEKPAKGSRRGRSKKATHEDDNDDDDDDLRKLKSLIDKRQKNISNIQSSLEELKEESGSKSSKYFARDGKKPKVQEPKPTNRAKGTKRKSDEHENELDVQQSGGKKRKMGKESNQRRGKEEKTTETKLTQTTKGKSPKGHSRSLGSKTSSSTKSKTPKSAQEKPSSSKKKSRKVKEVIKPKPLELKPGATLEEEVTALLQMHENIPMSQIPNDEEMMSDEDSDEDSDDGEDWEEVEDAEGSPHKSPAKSQVPKEAVEITIQGPTFNQKRKKKKFDMEEWFRLRVNRLKKETQGEAHKVHLLCLLAQTQLQSRLCNSQLLHCVAFSLVPVVYHSARPSQTWSLATLSKFMRWFQGSFSISTGLFEEDCITESLLLKRLETRNVASVTELVLLFIVVLRSVGLEARLISSLQSLTFKPTDLIAKGKSLRPKPAPVIDLVKEEPEKGKGTKKEKEKGVNSEKEKGTASTSGTGRTKNSKPRKRASKVGAEETDSKYFKRRKSKDVCYLSSEGSDFDDELTKFRTPKQSGKKAKGKKKKIISSDSDNSVEITKSFVVEKGTDVWAEVFLQTENRWVCVDCVRGKINQPETMEDAATRPISYILSADNDLKVKDITQKYAQNWVTQTRKLRIDEDWWRETLQPYRPIDLIKDKTEDYQIEALLEKKPLPTSMGEYKNNPLYALKRHLLKFEAIYPPDAAPVGFVKGEPVYARSAVKELHTKETWMKEARAIRRGEEAYKMVKARPKRGKSELPAEPTVSVYGEWQTEPYIPPPAVDGKVPRNEYGNVELFKPSMLPGGTVHLKLPGLNKVARKLNIDCAQAMIGWDFHGGFNHPMMDGFIVCEEHKDVLIAAWDEEQEIMEKREQEKREKRVLGNWKMLIKGLLLREQMKKKFNLEEANPEEAGEPSGSSSTAGKTAKKKNKKAAAQDVEMAWPLNRQAEKGDVEKEVATIQKKAKKQEENEAHMFPFEVM